MTSRRRWPLAALAVVALTGAGCGSDEGPAPGASDSPGTTIGAGTSTGAGGGTGTGGGTKRLSARDKAVRFAECIRAHGVSDFPDPDASNDFNYGVSVSLAVWQRATGACKRLQPPGTLSSKRDATQQKQGLAFARCVRANGVKDFPDPVDGEPLIDTYKIPSSDQPGGMTILNAATNKCKAQLDKATAGR
jgi:hypothetical protein